MQKNGRRRAEDTQKRNLTEKRRHSSQSSFCFQAGPPEPCNIAPLEEALGPPQNSAGGLKTRRMRCRSRFGSAFGVILGALALFFGPLRFTRAFQMRSGLHFGTLWTPKSMLPSRREHRFQKISVSAIYLHFGLKIPSQSDLLDAQMALKTRPKRLKSAPRRSWRRFLAVSGGLLERSWVPLGRFGALRALQGVPPRLFGTNF